jgi:hypothetical protein
MDFGPGKLGEMIHPNVVVQGFTFVFQHFVSNTIFLNVHPTPSDFVFNLEVTKLNMKPSSPKMVKAPIIHKNSYNS